ncbi:MAG: sensor histidine kinase, partial [Bacteroidales bacterium]
PLVYERWWFIPVCLATAALAIWLAYQLRVRRLRAQFAAVLAERARIARELHDTLIQGFSGITMEMQALVGRLRGADERSALEEIIDDAGTTLHEARESLAGLRSVQPRESNLANAIAQTARRLTEGKDVRVKLRLEPNLPRLDAEASYNLVRIAQEAIANAVLHSGAAVVEVALRAVDGGVELLVQDAGEGFEAAAGDHAQRGHYGLAGMRERASEIGAAFDVVTEPGRGTSVTVRVSVGSR